MTNEAFWISVAVICIAFLAGCGLGYLTAVRDLLDRKVRNDRPAE